MQDRPAASHMVPPMSRELADVTTGSGIVVTDGTFSELAPEESQLPGCSRVMVPYSNVTEVYEDDDNDHDDHDDHDDEGEEGLDEFSNSILSGVPDFKTAITSTPRRQDLDEDGPMVINLGLMRQIIVREKEEQQEEATNWYLDVRECLHQKTKPYSRKLKNRRAVLTNQITDIQRQREALDQLLTSLKRERRDIDKNIEYLDTFSEKFPAFPT